MPQDTAARFPTHVAIIVDGNRRWAKQRLMPVSLGHKAGFDRLREITRYAVGDRGVFVLSLYVFSTENFSRDAKEVGYLMDLFANNFRTIADAVELPIILYNIPARTGNKLLPETVQALCRDVENIVGAKDSSGDIENLKAYIRLTRELDKEVAILAGNDGAILTCLKEGGAGGIAGRANIWPETVAKIYDCFKAGDLEGAQAAQDAIAILQQTFKYGNPNTIIKTAVALQGHPVGKCRAPFNYVPEEGMEAIKKVLAENEAKGLH